MRPTKVAMEIEMCCGTCSDKMLVQEYIEWLESFVPDDAYFMSKSARAAVPHKVDPAGRLNPSTEFKLDSMMRGRGAITEREPLAQS